MRIVVFAVGLLLLGLQMTWAGPVATEEPAVIALMQSLPEKTVKRLREAPQRFLAEASVLIFGYGQDGAIDAAGLERFILLRRAEIRARTMRRLQEADLDNDGAITAPEMASLADAASAGERGRLRLAQQAADLDGDSIVTPQELRALAEIEALTEFTDEDADTLRGFLLIDRNGDGRVDLAEVRQVAELLAPQA